MKRALIIIAVVLVLVGIGIIAYLTFGPAAPHLTVTNNNFGDTGSGVSTATGTAAPSGTGEVTASTGAGTVVAPNLVEITSAPVAAGVSIVDTLPATTTAAGTATTTTAADIEVHYIDRQSGNVYAYRARARSLTRISNKTLPAFSRHRGFLMVRWLSSNSFRTTGANETLDTYALPANGSDGYFLAGGLDEAKVLGENSIFTLAAGTESAIGTISQLNGANAATLFNSPLSSIIVYPAGGSFIAVTKAASEIGGYAFSINPSTGAFHAYTRPP